MPTKSQRQARPKPASGPAKARKTASTTATKLVMTRGSGIGAPPQNTSQPKRTLTPENFFQTVANVVNSGPQLALAAVRPKISTALREKIFLGVSSVNDCRYCKWGHTHWSMSQGVTLTEVNQILSFQIESLEAKNPAEAAAILFAQHYAEHLDQFDHESIANLRKYFSDSQVGEILAYVRFITFTNLLGNTADVFLNRSFEGVVGAAAAPLALVLNLVAKFDRQVGMDGPKQKRV